MLSIRLTLGYLALVTGIESYLLAGPIGAGLYLALLFLCLLASPMKRHRAYQLELEAFKREQELACKQAIFNLRYQAYSYGGQK